MHVSNAVHVRVAVWLSVCEHIGLGEHNVKLVRESAEFKDSHAYPCALAVRFRYKDAPAHAIWHSQRQRNYVGVDAAITVCIVVRFHLALAPSQRHGQRERQIVDVPTPLPLFDALSFLEPERQRELEWQ